ncbi:hypothetical protein GCM10007416_05180 [Kroppenstedtia guangzhouensis]|uniref:Uncharacterized protein n=1 Tax=Kroppenstedtia guangzhouensis TaxID=1274356 RepID=A0ABQ1G276_9BACL|nr:hypothetical protein [Kroppenstedtia guangzhouensis]GGA35294.1 hypothetical protein GCM10007416_05180 [Kroppenstedtia guangzhouensis]
MKMVDEVEAIAKVKLNGEKTKCDYYVGQVLENTDPSGNRSLSYIKEIKSVKKEGDYLKIHVISVPIHMLKINKKKEL